MTPWMNCPVCATTILTGHNQRLYQRLSGGMNTLRWVGFTDRVWEYMEQADLMLHQARRHHGL